MSSVQAPWQELFRKYIGVCTKFSFLVTNKVAYIRQNRCHLSRDETRFFKFFIFSRVSLPFRGFEASTNYSTKQHF
jgi:hypothetical protein